MALRATILTLATLCLTTACTTTGTRYTPFQAALPGKFGFSEQRLETDRFRVVFEGNSLTTRQRVEDSLLLRAANLTLENGYDWFQIVNRSSDPKTFQIRSPAISSSWHSGFGPYSRWATTRVWSPRHGWVFVQTPFAFSSYADYGGYIDRDDVREVTRFQAAAEIVLGKGPRPADRVDAFNARDVAANLTPSVMNAPTQRP